MLSCLHTWVQCDNGWDADSVPFACKNVSVKRQEIFFLIFTHTVTGLFTHEYPDPDKLDEEKHDFCNVFIIKRFLQEREKDQQINCKRNGRNM